MLARMLRSEIGEVYNRGAWGQASLVTPAVIDLYKTPLRTQGWDAAIIEVCSAVWNSLSARFCDHLPSQGHDHGSAADNDAP